MNINEFARAFKPTTRSFPLIPRAVCADGFSISVQCCRGNYCSPREDFADQYESMELGYPSGLDEVTDSIIGEWAETPGTSDTVFGYVPVEVIDQLMEAHGGIKWVERNGVLVELRFTPLVTQEDNRLTQEV